MGENKQRNTNCGDYNCYGPGVTTQDGVQNLVTYKPNEWGERYRIREYGVPSTGYLHPPIVRSPPLFVEPLSVQLPNQFLNNLYIKYPFLIPSAVRPEEHKNVGQKSYLGDFDDLSTYQESYCFWGFPDPPELIEAKGLSLPEPERPPVRLPGVPYVPLCRRPLSPRDAIDVEERKKQKEKAAFIIGKRTTIPPKISEYEDNFNGLVRYWKRKGLYNDPCKASVPHKPTLPND